MKGSWRGQATKWKVGAGYSIRELPAYFSLIWSKKSSMICGYIIFLFLKPHEHGVAWEKLKFESVFLPGSSFTLLIFFINLDMTTGWEFAFLDTAIITFSLLYSLNIPQSTENPSFVPGELSVGIHCFRIRILAAFHHTIVVGIILKK